MPINETTVSLAAIGDTVIAASGVKFNAVNITGLTPGASCQLIIGNNPPVTVDDIGTWNLGENPIVADSERGLIVRNVLAQAGASVRIVPSYVRPGDKGGSSRPVVFQQ